MKKLLIPLVVLILLVPALTQAQDKVKEPSTGKSFPAQVSFSNSGKEYTLKVTGLAVRKKVIFKVYGIAHYIENFTPGEKEDAFKAVLTDGQAKQITMDFSRDVSPDQIKGAYSDGFKEQATPEELQKIQPLVDQFLGYFSKDVKENDTFILRWLPGGTIIPLIYGEEKPAITNVTFARVLWSIWFGEDSIVDRDDLIARMIAK